MLRPGSLLALHRQGRLHSSFHPIESPHWNVEYDYAVNSQLPRPDFHRLDTQPYGLQQSRPVKNYPRSFDNEEPA